LSHVDTVKERSPAEDETFFSIVDVTNGLSTIRKRSLQSSSVDATTTPLAAVPNLTPDLEREVPYPAKRQRLAKQQVKSRIFEPASTPKSPPLLDLSGQASRPSASDGPIPGPLGAGRKGSGAMHLVLPLTDLRNVEDSDGAYVQGAVEADIDKGPQSCSPRSYFPGMTAGDGTNINYEFSLGMSCQTTDLTLCAIPNDESEHENDETYENDDTEYENDETEYEIDKTKDTSNDNSRIACSDDLISKSNMRSHNQTRLLWLESDKQRLLSYKNKMGMGWADIFERFPNRTPGAIRLRYHMLAAREMEYEVEEILESMTRCKKLQYRAKWTGYKSDLGWYDASNFKNSVQRLHTFHESNPTQPGPPKRLEDWTRCFIEDRDDEDHSGDDEPCDEDAKEVLCRDVGVLLYSH
jgi:hypothetical protein